MLCIEPPEGFDQLVATGGTVAQCVALLPEVEAWWRDQAPSPPVSVLTYTFPGQRNASGGP